ncbi:MAG: hypothetical protein QM644_09200 [Mobilitalea sp.]
MKKLFIFLSVIAGILSVGLLMYIRFQKIMIKDLNGRLLKFKNYYNLYNVWIQSKLEGFSFSEKLMSAGYNKIGIYGNGEIGCRLYEELKGSDVQVSFFVDKLANDMEILHDENVPVITVNNLNNNCDVDVIIITTVNIFDEIKGLVEENTSCEIISVEDLFK